MREHPAAETRSRSAVMGLLKKYGPAEPFSASGRKQPALLGRKHAPDPTPGNCARVTAAYEEAGPLAVIPEIGEHDAEVCDQWCRKARSGVVSKPRVG